MMIKMTTRAPAPMYIVLLSVRFYMPEEGGC
jgi:hypothetical protein